MKEPLAEDGTSPDFRSLQAARASSPGAEVARTAARAVAVIAGSWQLGLLVRFWAVRVRYPWEIEWLESSVLYQAYRVMKGLPTYGPPRGGFLSSPQPPGYFMALALLGRIFGLDYAMGRTFSLVCSLAAGALVLGMLVRSHGARGWALAALAVGCAFSSTPWCEGFFDLIRADACALFLSVLCGALADAGPYPSRPRLLALALVCSSALYTRVLTVFFVAWVVTFVFVRHAPSGRQLAVWIATLCGVILALLQFTSHGWYWTNTVSQLAEHRVVRHRFIEGAIVALRFAPFTPAVLVLAVALAAKRRLSSSGALWLGMWVASVPASLLPFSKVGGFSNDFLPVFFFAGSAAAFVVGDLLAAFDRSPRYAIGLESSLLAAGALFLFHRTWDGKAMIPGEKLFDSAVALNHRVAALSGDVVASRDPFLPIRNGHTTLQWSEMGYIDMMWSNVSDLDLGGYIDRIHPLYALVSGNELETVSREISTRFQLDATIPDPPRTLIGDPSTMRYVMRANDDEPGGRVLFDFDSPEGWTGATEVFAFTTPTPDGQRPIAGASGAHLANSYSKERGAIAVGTLVSPPFLIDRGHLSLRVGGGFHEATRVELRVDGQAVRRAVGIWQGQETLTRVVWDVGEFHGKQAKLWLVDEDTGYFGYLLCDHVVLF